MGWTGFLYALRQRNQIEAAMPKRIQRRRVKGWRMPANAVSVTRPGKYGNPFQVGERLADDCVPNGYIIVSESDCLEFFENYAKGKLLDDPRWLDPLRGKDLACFCPLDHPCHADVLLRLVKELPCETCDGEGFYYTNGRVVHGEIRHDLVKCYRCNPA